MNLFIDSKIELSDLFLNNKEYTIFAGAGISLDPPSNLLSAKQIVTHLIEICCPPEECDKILGLKGLRYELIIEGIQKYFDDDLQFMNFFDYFERPNLIHYWLAHMIKIGNDVITTNFDYLIEYALMNLVDDNSQIIPIITKDNFSHYKDPKLIHKNEKFPLCKIHGSKKNIITNELTTNTLITTLSSLGKDREMGDTFAIEPFKKPLVENITKNRTLIICGYSGSDDFDIGPTLLEIR